MQGEENHHGRRLKKVENLSWSGGNGAQKAGDGPLLFLRALPVKIEPVSLLSFNVHSLQCELLGFSGFSGI